MSDRLHEVAQHIADYGLDADSWFALREVAAESLEDTGTHHVIRTQEELEALAREDADAIVLAGEAGVVRTVKALCGLRELVYAWGLPAVVIASGAQVRAAREAMEVINE